MPRRPPLKYETDDQSGCIAVSPVRPDGEGQAVHSPLAAPYALIRAGRPRPGQRPPTQLALLTQAITNRGQVCAWRAVQLRPDGRPHPSVPHRVEPRDVVATFCVHPSPGAIARARRSLRAPRAEREDLA